MQCSKETKLALLIELCKIDYIDLNSLTKEFLALGHGPIRISPAMGPKLESLRTSANQMVQPCEPTSAPTGPWLTAVVSRKMEHGPKGWHPGQR